MLFQQSYIINSFLNTVCRNIIVFSSAYISLETFDKLCVSQGEWGQWHLKWWCVIHLLLPVKASGAVMPLMSVKCPYFDNVLLLRYKISGHVMPTMREWMQKVVGADIDHRSPAQVRCQ